MLGQQICERLFCPKHFIGQKVMGKLVIPTYLKGMGWLATADMLCARIGVFLTWN